MTRRQLELDLGLAVVIGIVSQLEIWAPHALLTPTHMVAPRAAVSAGYLIATLALTARTRYPLAGVALVCIPLGVVWVAFGAPESFGTFALVMVTAYSVSARSSPQRAIAGLGLLLAAAVVWTVSDRNQRSPDEHLAGLAWLAPAIVVWLTGLFVYRHRLTEQQNVELAAERERQERARAAVDEERARIARELHDAVGHSVSVMTLQASAVRRLLKPDQSRELEALSAVERTGREALAEMRRMVGVLRDLDGEAASEPNRAWVSSPSSFDGFGKQASTWSFASSATPTRSRSAST